MPQNGLDGSNLGTFIRTSDSAGAAPILTVLENFVYAPPEGFIAISWEYISYNYKDYPNGFHDPVRGYISGYQQSDRLVTNDYPSDGNPWDGQLTNGSVVPPNDSLIFTGLENYSGTEINDGYPDDWIGGRVLIAVRAFGNFPAPNIDKPNYRSLLDGYSLDSRTVPDYPLVRPAETKKIKIKYYCINRLEAIPDLKTICWMVYECDLIENIPIKLPIFDCVLGTLYSDDPNFTSLLNTAANLPGHYTWRCLLPPAIPDLFNEWMALYTPTNAPNAGTDERVLCKLAANNNHWNNTDLSDNVDIVARRGNSHPMFMVDEARSYNWHIAPQPNDNGIGNLVMDSIRTIQTHAALNAGKWGVNTEHPDQLRADNLGWRIERGNQVLGIRVKADGRIDEELEKTTNRRLHVEGDQQNDIQKYNPNCFGSEGILVRHLPNKFSPNGTVAGGYRKIKDIPQYLAELHEQANAAMGYQEGTAIEIQLDGETYRYPNQLALMTEIFVTMKQSATYSKGAFFSSLIAEQTIKEVMAGLGLRTVDKFLEFKVAGKIVKLYYKGISASQSLRRKISAVTTNIGMVIGNII